MKIFIPNLKGTTALNKEKIAKTIVPRSMNNGSFHNKSIHVQDFHAA
jgi:hypothetical protein